MIILGIDPGTATTGFGIIKASRRRLSLIDFGWIKTSKELSPSKRLALIYKEMLAIIRKYKPEVMALEKLFFNTNAKTAMAVGEATGVIMLAAAKRKVPIFEYPPLQIKMSLTGYGRTNKEGIKKRIRKILNCRSPKHKKTHFDDVADALAVALCHAKKIYGKLNPERG